MMRTILCALCALCVHLPFAAHASAQKPRAEYDSVRAVAKAPPSPEEFLGYPLGARFTPAARVQDYARALAASTPLVSYAPYGETPEHRQLAQVVITSEANRSRLGEILAAHVELADPSTSEARAREIAARYPAVVYFSYGVHGNEASSSEAAMWTAWDLVRDGAESAFVRDSLVLVMDPVTNPDGRDRYVNWYGSVAGTHPNPDPQAREHREPWPGGRYNHYMFDLNRDWAWGSQPETRARLATWWKWNPLVHVDFHEMSPGSSYFFFPAAPPINPIYPEHILRWGERFGSANARAFDSRGWAYFTGDTYDLFYPGYGDSWPSLLGAIGMTYEQAGSGGAGLAVRRGPGDLLTLTDRATHHWTSGITTLRTAASGKSDLMLGYAEGQRSVGGDEPDVLLVPGADTLRLAELAAHLRLQGIAVERASRTFRLGAEPHPGFEARRSFPAGTLRVRASQARGRLATTLLAPTVPLRAETSYDISAWSLPFAYGVEAHSSRASVDAGWTPVNDAPAARGAPEAAYGYLVPPGLSSARGVAGLLRDGARVRVLSEPSTIGGREWPQGTWFLPRLGNERLRERVDSVGLGALVTPVETGLADDGVDLGSELVWRVESPRVGVFTGDEVGASSFGAHWFFLEQRLGLEFDALLLADLDDLDLGEVDVLIVPDMRRGALGKEQLELLRGWVERGGRLVAVAGGAGAVAPGFDVAVRRWPDPDSAAAEQHLRTRRERVSTERKEEVTGVILEVSVDSGHPLAWGATAGQPAFVLHDGNQVFDPAAGVESVAYFPGELEVTSGVISDENLKRLEHGVWLVSKEVGRGSVTLFADDPLFRMFWRQGHAFYANAVLIGPRG